MVLANRYDWQLFLEVTGPGGSGKSVMAAIARLLAGADNTTSATIDNLESARERARWSASLIILPDREKWSGDGAGIKAITGGDAVAIDPKYRDAYAAHIPAVILAVNNNPMQFSDRSGGISRRRVILPFPEAIAEERDPLLLAKITEELAVIVRHLMQRFVNPNDARALPVRSRVRRKPRNQTACRSAGRFLWLPDGAGTPEGMMIGNANITPAEPAPLPVPRLPVVYGRTGLSARDEPDGVRRAVPQTLKEYEHTLLKRRTKQEYRPT